MPMAPISSLSLSIGTTRNVRAAPSVLMGSPGYSAATSAMWMTLAGLRDASVRWVVTHDIAEWKNEIAWMSLYFSAAVWASLALCVCYSFAGHLPRFRTEASLASRLPNDLINATKQPPFMSHPVIGTYAGGLRQRFAPPQ